MIDPRVQVRVALYKNTSKVVLPIFVERAVKFQNLAYFEYSEVLKFNGALNKDGQHNFAGVFVKRHTDLNPGIDHPFNVRFDSNGDLYVSSQNTSLVARYHGPAGKFGKPGLPMPFPQSLDSDLNLPPGTFVPSAKHASNGLLEVREAIFAPRSEEHTSELQS